MEKKAKIIAIMNQKGGPGKTTFAVNIAGALARNFNKKVLVGDLDKQGNATLSLGIDYTDDKLLSIHDCILKGTPLEQAVIHTPFDNIDLIPSIKKYDNIEIQLSAMMKREEQLYLRFANYNLENYDYVILDLLPSEDSLLMLNGLTVADSVIIPIEAATFAIAGMVDLFNTFTKVKTNLNPRLEIEMIVLNKYNGATKQCIDTYQLLIDNYGEYFYGEVIHAAAAIEKAHDAQMPVCYFEPKSRAANEFNDLAKEVIKNGGQR